MKNAELWQPSKFVLVDGRLRSSSDTSQVGVPSRFVVDLVAAALSDAIPKVCRGRLLDLGCGKVPLYGTYRMHVDDVVCADWPQSLHPLQHVDVHCDLTQRLPFEGAAFDTVLLTDVLEHIPTPDQLLQEIARILKPGGALLGTVPYLYAVHEAPHDYFRYTEFALRRMAEAAGLVVERLEPYAGGFDVVFDTLAKTVVGLHWRVGTRLARMAQGIGSWVHHSALGRRTQHRWEQLPLGYIFVLRRAADGAARSA